MRSEVTGPGSEVPGQSSQVTGQRSALTQEVLVSAQSGWVHEELHEHVGGHDQNQTDPQQSRQHTVEEQPAGHSTTQ